MNPYQGDNCKVKITRQEYRDGRDRSRYYGFGRGGGVKIIDITEGGITCRGEYGTN
jgi:uncharacterized Zn finger protein